MSTRVTVEIVGPLAGDYARIGCADLGQAFDLIADLPLGSFDARIEVQHGDFVHLIEPSRGVYRAPGETPV